MNPFIQTIVSDDEAIRNRSLDSLCRNASLDELLQHAEALDEFRRHNDNLYHLVRSLFFLSAMHRFHIPWRLPACSTGRISFDAYQLLLKRRFREALDLLLSHQRLQGPNDGLSSALALAYHELAFQALSDQVRRSVRTVRGNRWMFRIGHPADHPLRIDQRLLQRGGPREPFPILRETTPVRMDFSHSAWSDIFFLGMDFPEGARVINASIDLAVRGRDDSPRPPIETYLRVIEEPLLRLVSTDLQASVELTQADDVFNFAQDYLGLLKAAVIASGLAPAGMEGCGRPMHEILEPLVGRGRGLELVSQVNDIPKGSRLAVSTNLLGSLISVCMRATGQVQALTGGLREQDRRLVAARAILGEWLGGSGGGWQDSGGVWPGVKLICGAPAREGDPEFGVSRGRLLPEHRLLQGDDFSEEARRRLQESLILVHGGMAQNVGPILEMVTEKYLLRNEDEWNARRQAMGVLDEILAALAAGDIRRVGELTSFNFAEPLQRIIPWCTNLYTDRLIHASREQFDEDFWGFWMLGGMSGGGMGFIFDPRRKPAAQQWLAAKMLEVKRELEHELPFAMDPVVYDFSINDRGSWAELLQHDRAVMPDKYFALMTPQWLRKDRRELSLSAQSELMRLSRLCRDDAHHPAANWVLDAVLPQGEDGTGEAGQLEEDLERFGFDRQHHEQIRADLRGGRIGLAQNRLPAATAIEDVQPADVVEMREGVSDQWRRLGEQALSEGQVAVVTLAAGVGSRWTEGAGVVKALHPFCRLAGRHRSFLETHLAKSRLTARQFKAAPPHVFTTGYLTQEPIRQHLLEKRNYDYPGQVLLSPGRSVGLRTIPMIRDLLFAWEETAQQVLDEQQEKVRSSARSALIDWARRAGEGGDYTDNTPLQCLHPVGHWYEVPNLLRNGVLLELIEQRPQLRYLMLHNVDTLGANLNPAMLGAHIDHGASLTFEVISRRLEDRGGGLARVDGRVRLLEGLAMPREQDEFVLSYYNSMTTWIDVDQLLHLFSLDRRSLANKGLVDQAVRRLARRIPTYITLKEVKKRWGHGQEDIFPVAQFEKLWSDMTALPEAKSRFLVVPLQRGRQLKEQAQLDGWLRDGGAAYVESVCELSR